MTSTREIWLGKTRRTRYARVRAWRWRVSVWRARVHLSIYRVRGTSSWGGECMYMGLLNGIDDI